MWGSFEIPQLLADFDLLNEDKIDSETQQNINLWKLSIFNRRWEKS